MLDVLIWLTLIYRFLFVTDQENAIEVAVMFKKIKTVLKHGM